MRDLSPAARRAKRLLQQLLLTVAAVQTRDYKTDPEPKRRMIAVFPQTPFAEDGVQATTEAIQKSRGATRSARLRGKAGILTGQGGNQPGTATAFARDNTRCRQHKM